MAVLRCMTLGGALLLASVVANPARAQTVPRSSQRDTTTRPDTSTKLQIYGFAMADAIYDFKQNNPDWFDVNRPSKLPKFDDEFGRDHRTWFSARQTRFGVKGWIPTGEGRPDIKTVFEFDLFGVGIDAGQTTIRPRHMYGQWGKWGAGQLESPFMDLDVFPNTLEYWGPNGMLFFRNVQIFYEPISKPDGTRARIALERPGASGDAGVLADRIELQSVTPRFPAPDISAEYRYGAKWGYVEGAGIVRWMAWDDNLPDTLDLNGHTWGWGLSLSGNYKPSKRDVIRAQAIYGRGVENYFNDAPVDVGVEREFGDPHRPIDGKALPDFGMVLYLDHNWSSKLSSAIGYSRVDIQNSDLQAPDAFKSGQYASTNLLWTPVSNILMGGEFLWGHRKNHSDGFSANDYRLQFSFKYSFSQSFGGPKK